MSVSELLIWLLALVLVAACGVPLLHYSRRLLGKAAVQGILRLLVSAAPVLLFVRNATGSSAELWLCAMAGGGVACWFLWHWNRSAWSPLVVPLAAASAFAWAGLEQKPQADIPLARHLPRQTARGGFVSSDSCRSCHPGSYQSWHDSYHRTMTQIAGPQTIHAPFDQVRLENRGRTYQLERRGDEFWVTMPDADWEESLQSRGVDLSRVASPPLSTKRVMLVTGSHHMQNYWVPGAQGRELFMLPFCYLIDEQRWLPSEDSFLKPPEAPRSFSHWNSNCIRCHSVAGNPGLDPATIDPVRNPSGTLNSEVAEFGISCEACHGPAAEHIQFHRNPLNRYARHLGDGPDPTIVNPARCTPQVSAQICGQCHSNFVETDLEGSFVRGLGYHAGGDLSKSHTIVRFEPGRASSTVQPDEPVQPDGPVRSRKAVKLSYWNDGTSCVGGDEYNGLLESPCYLRGRMSCLSCHSLHNSHPADQLANGMTGNQACTQCHSEDRFRDQLSEHSHHPKDSAGSLCYNCHMPYTSYALLTAMRSHRIDSPNIATSVRTGRPNACNLCHTDRTLAWSAAQLTDWFGAQPVEMGTDEQQVSAVLLWLLRGDALQRAIAAWHLGWESAREASGGDWQVPFLALALEDPYAAVRFVAERSLRQFSAFGKIEYDFLGSVEHRAEVSRGVSERWAADGSPGSKTRPELLLSEQPGGVLRSAVERLLQSRDQRSLTVPE